LTTDPVVKEGHGATFYFCALCICLVQMKLKNDE